MSWLRDVPELCAFEDRRNLIRIPPELDVPLTPRVRAVVDTPQFRRLAKVSQLGLVQLAYPGAGHQRFEHSLGVYRLTLLFLTQLHHDERFRTALTARDAELLIVAALLHDLGHWPYCHPVEDLLLPGIPKHEELAADYLAEPELADVLRGQWGFVPETVARLLQGKTATSAERILGSILSCPIDVDKMDYLARDSLHAGVPYGRNFDQQRLIGSLCLNAAGDGLAITEKGRTAAEMLVFARYVMFSEVYWHHTVRAATAMLQRAVYLLHARWERERVFRMTDEAWSDEMTRLAAGVPAAEVLAGLFGPVRNIYKRLAQFSYLEDRALYERLARRPYPFLVRVSEAFAEFAGKAAGQAIPPHAILFDAPPVEREIEFDLDVYYPKERRYRRLGEVSPVVRTLAREQFEDYVKRVRVYVRPELRKELAELPGLREVIVRAIETAERDCDIPRFSDPGGIEVKSK